MTAPVGPSAPCNRELSDQCNMANPTIRPVAHTPMSTMTESGPKRLRNVLRRFPGRIRRARAAQGIQELT